MKKTLLITLISGFGFFASAQSFDVGLKGAIASTWLLNENVSNAGTDEDYVSSMSFEYGLHLCYNFPGGCGIEMEVISEPYTVKYKGAFTNPPQSINYNGTYYLYVDNETYTATTTVNEIKIPLLFHYESTGGLSLEVGPEYAIISSATYSANFTGQPKAPFAPSSVSYSTKSAFASGNFLPVIGFGWDIKLSSQLYLLTDLRIEYGLTDLKGVDGHGQDLNNPALYQSNKLFEYTYAPSAYTPTHSLEGSLSLGLFYRIPTGSSNHSKM